MKRSKINPISKKRRLERKEYAQLRLTYLKDHNMCEACGRFNSCEIHHKKGTFGKRLLDVTYFMAVCRPCHRYITDNPIPALEKGWRLPL